MENITCCKSQERPVCSPMPDYKKRFLIEYYQLEERVIKLREILFKAKHDALEFKLSCPVIMLKYQLDSMTEYLKILIIRSFEESIHLEPSNKVKDVEEAAFVDYNAGQYE